MPRRVLGLFAKRPLVGQVKTRLAAATSPDFAVRVADAFLRDTLTRLGALDADRILVFTPADAEPFFAELTQDRFRLLPQGTGDLGQRLSVFVETQFQIGASAVVLIGADSPTLPLEYVEQAFHGLERTDVVLGPATDGGYYLIGCTRFHPWLFDGITWGMSTVLRETVDRLREAGLKLTLLPPWYDVDTLDGWHMLHGHLAALRRAGVDPGVPHTESLFLKDSS